LEFNTNHFAGFVGECVIYARGHIPGGNQQQHVEPLSGNAIVKLPGTPVPHSSAPGVSRVSQPQTISNSGRAAGDRNTENHALDGTRGLAPTSAGSDKPSRWGWIVVGLALIAVAGAIVLRAISRGRSDVSGSKC
jgi:hypothetical protein